MQCSPCHAEQASLLLGVTTTDGGLLAVGLQLPPSQAVAYRSEDGRSWTPDAAFDAGTDTRAMAAAAGGGRHVIVGSRGSAAASWTAEAGTPWQAAPDQPSLRPPTGGSAEMRAVGRWRDLFVAVGTVVTAVGAPSAAAWTSSDGLAWDLVGFGPAFEGAIAYGTAGSQERVVVVGATGERGQGPAVAWVSEDGTTWTRVDSPAFSDGTMRGVAHTGDGFVAVGASLADDRAAAWSSTDGRTWEPAPAQAALENHGRPIRMTAVTADPRGLLAGGLVSDAGNGSGVVWRSADGRAWERVPTQVSMSGASLAGVLMTERGPVAVGTAGSPDNDQASAWYEGP